MKKRYLNAFIGLLGVTGDSAQGKRINSEAATPQKSLEGKPDTGTELATCEANLSVRF